MLQTNPLTKNVLDHAVSDFAVWSCELGASLYCIIDQKIVFCDMRSCKLLTSILVVVRRHSRVADRRRARQGAPRPLLEHGAGHYDLDMVDEHLGPVDVGVRICRAWRRRERPTSRTRAASGCARCAQRAAAAAGALPRDSALQCPTHPALPPLSLSPFPPPAPF